MGLSASLDVGLGLALTFLIFSLLASRINETVATALNWRGAGLVQALTALVGPPIAGGQPDPAGRVPLSVTAVKRHPLVRSMETGIGGKRGISYLPARTFSAVLLDLLGNQVGRLDPTSAGAGQLTTLLARIDAQFLTAEGKLALATLRAEPSATNVQRLAGTVQAGDDVNLAVVAALQALLPGSTDRIRAGLNQLAADANPAAQALQSLFEAAGGDLEGFRQQIEQWYDDQMDRVSGWYKRRVQLFVTVYGAVLVIAFNVDAISIAQNLWTAPVQRSAVATAAAAQAGSSPTQVDSAIAQVKTLALPVGWDFGASRSHDRVRAVPASISSWLVKLLGLVLSAVAVGFGAPFWFDTLSRLSNLRGAGSRPQAGQP
ncbi:MAG: hypothetical protein ABI140_08680 [Jatrophihabitantaceae bacterium]